MDLENNELIGKCSKFRHRDGCIKFRKLRESAMHSIYRSWESKYDGIVLKWFSNWVVNQSTSTPSRVPIGSSFGLYVRGEGYKGIVPGEVIIQIMREFGISGRGLYLNNDSGRIIGPNNSKWLRDQLEAQRGVSIVGEVAKIAYEEATDKAEDIIEDVVEEEIQQASGVIDDLTAQLKSNTYKMEQLLKENSDLRKALSESNTEIKLLKSDVKKFGESKVLLNRPVVSKPPPPPPPPPSNITVASIRNDEKAIEKIALKGKIRLSKVADKAETAVRDSASSTFSQIKNVDFSDFMKKGAARRKAANKKKKDNGKDEEKSTGNFLQDALRKRFANTRQVSSKMTEERVFEITKQLLRQIACGDVMISPLGYMIYNKKKGSSIGCDICSKSPAPGTCVCGKGSFCSQTCLNKNWSDGHEYVCKGKKQKKIK